MDTPKRQRRRALVSQAVDTALVPFQTLISKPAQKAYLGTALFGITSFILFVIASVAFWLFYWEYVPQPGVERVVHLQFSAVNPQGQTSFPNALVSEQAYDIALILHVPRTPSNIQTGNFMLSLSLFSSPAGIFSVSSLLPPQVTANNDAIALARRPAILTYTSPLTATAFTLSSLPLYLLGWSKESEILVVPMFEGVEFAKGIGNIPQAAKVEVESDEKMQFYELRIRIIAKLSGLRWVLYNHRITSFFVFTTTFWGASLITMGIVWLFLNMYMQANTSASARGSVKNEEDGSSTPIKNEPTPDFEFFDPNSLEDLSDTPRTFPTLGRQKPLRYSAGEEYAGSSAIKREDDIIQETAIQPLQATAAEADDEDDFEDAESTSGSAWRDSGIGTGVDEERRAGGQRRKNIMGSGAGR